MDNSCSKAPSSNNIKLGIHYPPPIETERGEGGSWSTTQVEVLGGTGGGAQRTGGLALRGGHMPSYPPTPTHFPPKPHSQPIKARQQPKFGGDHTRQLIKAEVPASTTGATSEWQDGGRAADWVSSRLRSLEVRAEGHRGRAAWQRDGGAYNPSTPPLFQTSRHSQCDKARQ